MEAMEAAGVLGALAQEKRLELVRLLLAAGPSGLEPRDLAARLGMPSSTLSFHLAALERAGLTQSTRRGRQMLHAVRVMGLRSLLMFLTETCCAGHPELCFESLLAEIPEEPSGMTAAFNVLFLCTHNAARSIMAEAILAKMGGGRFKAYSAGSEPGDAPVPAVIEKLRVLGHDVDHLHSKSWNIFTGPAAPRIDFVITLCDTLDGQVCPDFGDLAVTGAWPLPDPAKFKGSAIELSTMLNELYASLHRRLSIFTALPFASLDRMAMKSRLDALGGGGLPVTAGAR
jgi:ArsR family transcriptional regulator, arsenate/arsenite/antimonite-responsive transcriptional repressor / arsenate reductase (thioredoxin)